MNRKELTILRELIGVVRCWNQHAWWQLKRETFDFGYQTHYPAQAMFDRPARVSMASLTPSQLGELRVAWSGYGDLPQSDQDLMLHYSRQVVAEIVRRARIAGYRTENW